MTKVKQKEEKISKGWEALERELKEMGVYDKFIKNLEVSKSSFKTNSASGILMMGFNWSATPEGDDYWAQIYEELADRVG